MSLKIESPFAYFPGADGLPLDNGAIYIGTTNLNPETNPIAVYFDDALTTPAAQPIRTSGGYTVRNGTPASIYTAENNFSITVRDSAGTLVYSAMSATAVPLLSSSGGSALVGHIDAGTGAVARTVQNVLREDLPLNVRAKGAIGDGTTDDLQAFLDALASGASTVVADGVFRLSAGITIPAGVTLVGGTMLPSRADAKSYLIFDNSVATCITLAGTGLQTSGIRDVCIFREAGAPPSGSAALFVDRAYNSQIENVFAYGHAKAWKFSAITTNGISAMMRNCYAGAITEDYFDIDSWPELRVIGGRMGTNGVGDAAGNSFVRITGTSPSSLGIGPNGIVFENVQFNQGVLGPDYWIDFDGITTPIGNQVFFSFSHCHIENIATAYLRAAAAGTAPARVSMQDCQFNTHVPFFDWVSTAVINEWRIANCFVSATTFAPTADTINGLSVVGNSFSGCAITYNAPSGQSWNVASAANHLVAASTMAITGSGWTSGFFADTLNSGSTITNTATPRDKITIVTPGASLTSWTPTLEFGGASTGITYSTQSGACHVVGNCVTYQFRITLSSKGSATGAARIKGFPISQNAAAYQSGGGGAGFGVSGMVGLTAPILLNGPVGSPASIQLVAQGATALSALTDAHFSNTSNIAGVVTFFL